MAKCWKTMYHPLGLYATLPETKIVMQRNSPMPVAMDGTLATPWQKSARAATEKLTLKSKRLVQSKVDQLKRFNIDTATILKIKMSPEKLSGDAGSGNCGNKWK